ncbi:MAG: zinc-binding dehydrogenase [Thaumarchaeota archaeon]|nr:zinc-binding dehydrogenase [Nitrososphaerota archaeon]
MATSLSARFYGVGKELRLEEVPVPSLGDDDVELELKAAGVCHSDLHTMHGMGNQKNLPMTLGHEGSGIIAAVGRSVKNVSVGDRVGYDYIWSCGRCSYCLSGRENICDSKSRSEGTWQERIIVPARHVHKIPAGLGFPEGAVLNCAVMTGYHATKLAETKPGVSVLVYGLGGVGMNLLKWTKLAGAAEIIAVDSDEERLRVAKREGATITINPTERYPLEEVKRLTSGGVDIAFEVIGKTETVRNTLSSVRQGGKSVLIGQLWEPFQIHILKDIQFGEKRILSPEDHTKSEIYEVLRLIETNRFQFGDSITHRFPLREANQAVNVLQNRIGNPGRVILEP